MKQFICLGSFLLFAGVVSADGERGLAALQALGSLNGQALACSQMTISGQAKNLMIKHAPKTRRYGEVFEEATNRAFLQQGQGQKACLQPLEFTRQLNDLADLLQATLPATP